MRRAQLNAGHHAIARFAEHIERVSIVTQNVDDLHERAGQQPVYHLHGVLHQSHCMVCGVDHPTLPQTPELGDCLPPPICQDCGGWVRPSVVWFGEALPEAIYKQAQGVMQEADVILVVGTSGMVSPACDMPYEAKQSRQAAFDHGPFLVQINPTSTLLDHRMDCNLYGTAANTLPALLKQVFEK